ncbi:MAG TPA: acetylxylan esterase [Solirubrobacterales bacterium]|nr:acetylxylan esterase [Solirubrobacterales bacterium]
MRKLAVAVAVAVTTFFAQGIQAQAAVTDAFDGAITCTTQPAIPSPLPGSEYAGQRWCGSNTSLPGLGSTVDSWDGTPIDVNFALPPEPGTGPDGNYPVVMIFHGWGGMKSGFTDMQRWLSRGYAVFSMTDRGFHESCGSAAARLTGGTACDNGYIHLLDTRYEVRDAQYLAGLLVDDGLISPTRIATTGGSYGGGLSMALAALKNRVMLPDGALTEWKSPAGTDMSLAVAIPSIPWTDLAYSLVPNGNNLDYIEDASYYGRFGVMKESWVNLLYTLGLGTGNYAAAGEDPGADLTGWKSVLDAGEPYDGQAGAQAILDEITAHHSSYYIDHSIQPAPLLIYSGFTDDLFPVDEATRFYNRTRAQYPNAKIGLIFGPNSGHMRGMSKSDATAYQQEVENQWVDFYLKDEGAEPASNVRALLQTCPANAPVGDPYVADDWASISPGEIRLVSPESQTVSAGGGDPASAGIFNPAPTGQACSTAPGGKETGTASYELDPAPAGGFTVLGAPTVVAKIQQEGVNSQIAARLVDVSPDGTTKLLVARGLWRPQGEGFQVFQLHANAWKVEEGHVLRLELLPKDASVPAGLVANYGRPSNGQTDATVTDLDLRIPVADQPGAAGGLVSAPAAKVLPDRPGVKLAPGYDTDDQVPIDDYEPPPVDHPKTIRKRIVIGKVQIKGKRVLIKAGCPKTATVCPKARITVAGAKRKTRGTLARIKGVVVKPGENRLVSTRLTKRGQKVLKQSRGRKLAVKVTVKPAGMAKRTVRRVARVTRQRR